MSCFTLHWDTVQVHTVGYQLLLLGVRRSRGGSVLLLKTNPNQQAKSRSECRQIQAVKDQRLGFKKKKTRLGKNWVWTLCIASYCVVVLGGHVCWLQVLMGNSLWQRLLMWTWQPPSFLRSEWSCDVFSGLFLINTRLDGGCFHLQYHFKAKMYYCGCSLSLLCTLLLNESMCERITRL